MLRIALLNFNKVCSIDRPRSKRRTAKAECIADCERTNS